MKVDVSTQVELDVTGERGAMLFIWSPILGGACYYWWIVEAAQALHPQLGETNLSWLAALGVAAGAVGWSMGVIRLLTGRVYRHAVKIDAEDQRPAEPQAQPH